MRHRPLLFTALLCLVHPGAAEAPDIAGWTPLERRFESTGGGG